MTCGEGDRERIRFCVNGNFGQLGCNVSRREVEFCESSVSSHKCFLSLFNLIGSKLKNQLKLSLYVQFLTYRVRLKSFVLIHCIDHARSFNFKIYFVFYVIG